MKSRLPQKITIRENWRPIAITNRRKTALFLLTIHELAQGLPQGDLPCLEDLVLIYNFEYDAVKQMTTAMRGYGQLARHYGTKDKKRLVLTELLALSQASRQKLPQIQDKVHQYDEWQVVLPRIRAYLQTGPGIVYFPQQRRITYFTIREILKKIHPFLSKTVSLPEGFAQLVLVSNLTPVHTQKGIFSANELLAQILGFIDHLYRLQGEYIPFITFQTILRECARAGIHLERTKRKLYSYHRGAAKVFGRIPIEAYYKAVTKALQGYCRQFLIPDNIQSAILELINELQRLRRFTRDPESHALGLLGTYLEGFFLVDNTRQYPLAPDLWSVGRDQMHQLRKLLKKGVLKGLPPANRQKPAPPPKPPTHSPTTEAPPKNPVPKLPPPVQNRNGATTDQ